MKKKSIIRLAIMTLIISTLIMGGMTGCGKSPKNDGKSIKIFVGGTMFSSSLDPIKGGMAYGYSFINNGLTKVSPKSKYVGDLADSWTISSDARTYTFKLRDGIKFHDGTKFSAKDVVFTYEKVKANQGKNESVDLSRLKSVVASDDKTVVFTLTEPYSSFLDQTALLGIVPKDKYDSKTFDKKPIGTGAWKVAQFDTDQKIILKANKVYHDGAPQIEQITLMNMNEETAIANAKSGELDVVMVASNYVSEKIEGMKVEKLPTMDVRQISLPVTAPSEYTTNAGKKINVGNEVTSDKAVRKALSIGIDRKEIIKNGLSGIGKPATGFTKNLEWGNPPEYTDNQKAAAKKTLEDAGWKMGTDGIYEKNGKKCQFKVISPSNDKERYQLVAAVAEEAKKIGIKIDIEQKGWDEITGLSSSNGVVWGWGQFDPVVLKSLFHSASFTGDGMGNTVRYSNPKVDKLINDALSSGVKETILDNWKAVQKATAEDYAYLYIVNIEHSYFIKNNLDISKDTQIPHPHGHGAPVINNMKDWKIKK